MTPMPPSLVFFIVVVSAVFASGFATAQSQDPATYFGGTENGAYLDWLQFQGTSYKRTEFLPSPAGNSTGAAIHWTIQDDEIFLAVAAKATGWVGFGIAESGGKSKACRFHSKACRFHSVLVVQRMSFLNSFCRLFRNVWSRRRRVHGQHRQSHRLSHPRRAPGTP